MFSTIEEAIIDIKNGKMVIVVDDEDRENEGDLVMAGELVTPQIINFMATYGRGLICIPITKEKAESLELNHMVYENTDNHQTAFTVSIDFKDTDTGISAYERCDTVKKLLEDDAKPSDFRRPGHIFPLISKDGGVLKRAGHTEAAVDLAQMAGLYPAGVICEIMNDDGTMARVDDLKKYAKKHNLKLITIKDLIQHRKKTESLIKREAVVNMPTKHGNFVAYAYTDKLTGKEHIALVKGEIDDGEILVRVHSECLTGDVFSSLKCDCKEQLEYAMKAIEEKGKGILLYMRQEGRGIGLINKLKAYELQEKGYDTVDANLKLGFEEDLREYGIGAQILADLGVKKINLMTNNPRKIKGLEGYGIEILSRVPIEMKCNKNNNTYLKTKKEKLGHIINI